MTEETRHGRPTGHVLSAESRAAISEGVTRAWADPEKRARLNDGKSEASRRGWETRRRKAEQARLLAEQAQAGETHLDETNVPQPDTQTRLDLLAAGLEAATGKPVQFVDITNQIRKDVTP